MSNTMKRTHPHQHDFHMRTVKNCAAVLLPLGHPCPCDCDDTPDLEQHAGVRGIKQKYKF